MTRYQITFSKPSVIFDGQGMIHSLVSPGPVLVSASEMVVYIESHWVEKFEKLLEGHKDVKSYMAHPIGNVKAKRA